MAKIRKIVKKIVNWIITWIKNVVMGKPAWHIDNVSRKIRNAVNKRDDVSRVIYNQVDDVIIPFLQRKTAEGRKRIDDKGTG